jgi:hypothetical protein
MLLPSVTHQWPCTIVHARGPIGSSIVDTVACSCLLSAVHGAHLSVRVDVPSKDKFNDIVTNIVVGCHEQSLCILAQTSRRPITAPFYQDCALSGESLQTMLKHSPWEACAGRGCECVCACNDADSTESKPYDACHTHNHICVDHTQQASSYRIGGCIESTKCNRRTCVNTVDATLRAYSTPPIQGALCVVQAFAFITYRGVYVVNRGSSPNTHVRTCEDSCDQDCCYRLHAWEDKGEDSGHANKVASH